MKELNTIQNLLKAPKNQYNKFGNYKYRNCEDILEAVKPLLFSQSCTLTISDEIVMIGTRYYVRALRMLTGKRKRQRHTHVRTSQRREWMQARSQEAHRLMHGSTH